MNNEYLKIISSIQKHKDNFTIMEVCGTHTMNIGKFGIRNIMPSNINILSGPGCPICVTPTSYIDYIYNLASSEDVIIATYGDMMRVPGSEKNRTLEKVNSLNGNVRIVYSSLDALKIANENKNKKVVFLGLGFETTVPATAIAIREAENNSINNFYILSLHKRIQPALEKILNDGKVSIDGILCPGNVAVIIGEDGFRFLKNYDVKSVICGFSRKDILTSINILINNKTEKKTLFNNYKLMVKKGGNEVAKELIDKFFEIKRGEWRGIGGIDNSSLVLKGEYKRFDIENVYSYKKYGGSINENIGCKCGEILQGKAKPIDCKLFGDICNIENPIGPCMVSSEGTCAAYYKYRF